MWVSDYLSANSFSQQKASCGEITSTDGAQSSVISSNERFGVKALAPYGIRYVPVVGSDSVMIHTDKGDFLIGVMQAPSSLEAGELELRSLGGASIVLKNDGRVLINGRTVE